MATFRCSRVKRRDSPIYVSRFGQGWWSLLADTLSSIQVLFFRPSWPSLPKTQPKWSWSEAMLPEDEVNMEHVHSLMKISLEAMPLTGVYEGIDSCCEAHSWSYWCLTQGWLRSIRPIFPGVLRQDKAPRSIGLLCITVFQKLVPRGSLLVTRALLLVTRSY